MKIDGIFSKGNQVAPLAHVQQKVNLKPLEADSVSFRGVQSKVVSAGTDVILDLLRKCSDLLANGKKNLVTDAVSLMQAGKINEAIELSKKYGAGKESTFINGILGGFSRDLEPKNE